MSEGITISDLTKLCENFATIREEKKQLEDKIDGLNAQLNELQALILEQLVAHEMSSFKGSFGTVSAVHTKTFKQPASIEKKLELFDYLRKQNLFDEMVKVDSRTLSAWASREVESREREGQYGFLPPGLEQPVEFVKLSLRKK